MKYAYNHLLSSKSWKETLSWDNIDFDTRVPERSRKRQEKYETSDLMTAEGQHGMKKQHRLSLQLELEHK